MRVDSMHPKEQNQANKPNVSSDWVTGEPWYPSFLSHVFKITVSSPVHNLSGRKLPHQTGQLSATGIESATGALPVIKNLFSLRFTDKPVMGDSCLVPEWVNQSSDYTAMLTVTCSITLSLTDMMQMFSIFCNWTYLIITALFMNPKCIVRVKCTSTPQNIYQCTAVSYITLILKKKQNSWVLFFKVEFWIYV